MKTLSVVLCFLIAVCARSQKVSDLPPIYTISSNDLVMITTPGVANYKSTFSTMASNLSGQITVTAMVTNAIATAQNLSTTNTTNFGLFYQVQGLTNLQFFGLQQGTNVVLYRNGSNVVVNATGTAGAGVGNAGQTLYLDSAFGNDSTATRTNAAKPFLTVSNALAVLTNGDTLVVRGGTYLINPKLHGSATTVNQSAGVALSNKTDIKISGEAGAIWQMSSWATYATTSSCPMLTLYRCTNVVIDGMKFLGGRTNSPVPYYAGITIDRCQNVTIMNSTVENWQDHGVADLTTTSINRDMFFYNNTFKDCGGTNNILGLPSAVASIDGAGINVNGTNIVAIGNRFIHNLRDFEICCNADSRQIIFADNITEECVNSSILLISTNASEIQIVGNKAIGFATNAIDLNGATWIEAWAGSNVLVQGNQLVGYGHGILYTPSTDPSSAFSRMVDWGIYDNSFLRCPGTPINIHRRTGNNTQVERISIMRNKFASSSTVAVSIGANHSRIEWNEFQDCNNTEDVIGVIRVGTATGAYTNATNISIIGNRIYTSMLNANTRTAIVIHPLIISNSVWGNDIRGYAAEIQDSGTATRLMPLNKISPGKLLASDTNSLMTQVTLGGNMTYDSSTATLNSLGGVGTTNGNQFGASSAITIKDGAIVTNLNDYVTLKVYGNVFVATNLYITNQLVAGSLSVDNFYANSMVVTTTVAAASLFISTAANFATATVTNAFTLQRTTNQVIFGATNIAPSSAVAPTKWISVQVTGDSGVYRIPLYE